jgi:GNAT superfamily N-acetyltransferase
MYGDSARGTPILYYKRYRMEVDLLPELPAVYLPQLFYFIAWREELIDLHAEVNQLCFRGELDSDVFPCLGDAEGCRRLMREIRGKPGFLPESTWLIGCATGCVGTIQSVIDPTGVGSIQNVGVIPGYRGHGLGRALVGKALQGFRHAGLRSAYLEVTAENEVAVRLYRSLGFHRTKTSYRAVSV